MYVKDEKKKRKRRIKKHPTVKPVKYKKVEAVNKPVEPVSDRHSHRVIGCRHETPIFKF